MTSGAIKIQKFLADAGICSRRQAENLVRQGLVKLNGAVITDPSIRVNPGADTLEYQGQKLAVRLRTEGLLLYKTAGYITSTGDPHNARTVYDLLPEQERAKRWIYVGRLDLDSEGLLLFTNNGALAHRLTHPSFKVAKHYRVEVEGKLEKPALEFLVRGIEIQGRLLRMDRVKILRSAAGRTTLEVVLHQGEKRQIKKMLEHLGYPVLGLCRTRFGPLSLDGLEPGQCRPLDKREIEQLEKTGRDTP